MPRLLVRYSTSLREKAAGGYELDPGSDFARVSGWLASAGAGAEKALKNMLHVELLAGSRLESLSVVGKVGVDAVHLGKEDSPDIELRDIALWVQGHAPEALSERQILNALGSSIRFSLRSGKEQIALHGSLELRAPISGLASTSAKPVRAAKPAKKRWIVEVSRQQWASISVEASSAEEALRLAQQGSPEADWQTDKPRDWTFSEPQEQQG